MPGRPPVRNRAGKRRRRGAPRFRGAAPRALELNQGSDFTRKVPILWETETGLWLFTNTLEFSVTLSYGRHTLVFKELSRRNQSCVDFVDPGLGMCTKMPCFNVFVQNSIALCSLSISGLQEENNCMYCLIRYTVQNVIFFLSIFLMTFSPLKFVG